MANSPAWVNKVLGSKKYKALALNEETIHDLIRQVEADGIPAKQVEKAVREKYHNIVAPYLEDVDYQAAMLELDQISDHDITRLYPFAEKMLRAHTSTNERMEILDEFYGHIAGQFPEKNELTIADLACAMNPLAIQWMQLPQGCEFLAYDLNGARIALINCYFQKLAINAQAIHADILVDTPNEPVDAVFFFKEAHRFEQRQKGSTRKLLRQINAPLIFVSLPSRNMTGRHDLKLKHTKIMQEAIKDMDWQMQINEFGKELLFTIRK
ncbi:MAG: hypothetical protein JEZ00_01545 [Anaerolineaceae bacterium]|nr:hypothetical protein [Anaerolineaceae bacterium]